MPWRCACAAAQAHPATRLPPNGARTVPRARCWVCSGGPACAISVIVKLTSGSSTREAWLQVKQQLCMTESGNHLPHVMSDPSHDSHTARGWPSCASLLAQCCAIQRCAAACGGPHGGVHSDSQVGLPFETRGCWTRCSSTRSSCSPVEEAGLQQARNNLIQGGVGRRADKHVRLGPHGSAHAHRRRRVQQPKCVAVPAGTPFEHVIPAQCAEGAGN